MGGRRRESYSLRLILGKNWRPSLKNNRKGKKRDLDMAQVESTCIASTKLEFKPHYQQKRLN
jgi:hypothetical protein